MTQASERLQEASLPTVLLPTKTKTRIGTWNIRTLYETGRIAQGTSTRLKIVMGDINAKVGMENAGKELIMGKQGVGTRNENGELFVEFCSFNDLAIGGTIFPHKTIHKVTWTSPDLSIYRCAVPSPDGRTQNQIDHITIGRKWRRSLQDVRAKRGADAASDHQLVIAVLKLKLKAYRYQAYRSAHKFNVQYLKNKAKAEEY
ncbi:hypothetical protein EGW08_015534 [Elysia chlorotica]|uniref:Endonuclease/exonuclease/phosphatase domain-containing protein n=1 Tax=Elysia chlorotica TaxID=188477 RepID=A0A433T586_ELYCH|nr:hypothetical protein EGW08_015534 [Elysia chlorotica]